MSCNQHLQQIKNLNATFQIKFLKKLILRHMIVSGNDFDLIRPQLKLKYMLASDYFWSYCRACNFLYKPNHC